MSKSVVCLVAFVLITFGMSIANAAPQTGLQSGTIGIIDMTRIMAESPKVKTSQQQLNQVGAELTRQIEAEKPSLSQEEFKQKQEAAYQEFLRQKKELENQIDLSVKKAIEEVAKEKKISVIVYKNSVAYGGVDITSEVISRMQ